MVKKVFILLLSLSALTLLFFALNQNISLAQIKPNNDSLYMVGSVDKDRTMTGFFGKNHQDIENKNWCVFIGENGKVYKISLIERNIHELYIDGQKIADNQIWKHTAEYKSFLEKFWRNEEIEDESSDLESKIKPIDRKIEAISKEIEKLDRAEEKLDKDLERNSTSFADNKKSINAQQKRLSEIENELDEQIENLSKQQEKLSDEQESLNLMDELDKVLEQISADLKSLGVIKSSKNLSFKLSNVELIVNGKKVSPEVFELLKARYIVEMSGESGFLYRWKGNV